MSYLNKITDKSKWLNLLLVISGSLISLSSHAACTNQVITATGASASITSSGDYSTSYPAWKAFDNSSSTMWISSTYPSAAWLAYSFSAPKVVTSYSLNYVNGSITSRAPKNFQLQGSNGSSWVVLDNRTNEINWNGVETRSYTISNPGSYQSYRLYVTDDNDATAGIVVISLGELRLETCTTASREDLSVTYPFLKQVDQKNATYSQSAPGFKGRSKVNTARANAAANGARTDGTVEEDYVFHLGQGFDGISSVYRSQCLDQTHPDFKILSTPSSLGTSLEVKRITSRTELYKALDTSSSLAASATFSIDDIDITAGVDTNSSNIRKEYLDETTQIFVVSYVSNKKHYSLTTQPRPLKAEYADNNLLVPFSEKNKRAFFKECGDRYVDNVELGGKLYIVFSYNTKRLTSEAKSAGDTKIQLDIADIFKGGVLSTSRASEIKSDFSKYQLSVKAYSLGGPDNIAALLNDNVEVTTYKTHLDNFANGINDTNIKALIESYRDYTAPQSLSGYYDTDIFANTINYAYNAQKYIALSNEWNGRCNAAKEFDLLNGSQFANLKSGECNNQSLLVDIKRGKNQCASADNWDTCVLPTQYTLPSGASLISTLTDQIYSFDYVSLQSRTASNSITGGLWNKKCISDTVDVCLAAGCQENKAYGVNSPWGGPDNAGYQYNEISYSSPANSDEQGYRKLLPVYTNSALQHCAQAAVKACTQRLGGSSANYKFNLTIWGVCPVTKSFPTN